MKILLLEDHDKLGEAGSVVNVANGYARNFLLPRKIAAPALPELLNRVKAIKATAEKKRLAELTNVKEIFTNLLDKTILIPAKVGKEARLFGSVTVGDIVHAIKAQLTLNVDKRWLDILPIKFAGQHDLQFKYRSELTTKCKLIIYPENMPPPIIASEPEGNVPPGEA